MNDGSQITIVKKCHPPFFEAMMRGVKTFEARLADENYPEGAVLLLNEWDPKTKKYTGRILRKRITYVVKTKDLDFFSEEDIKKYGLALMSVEDLE